MKKQEKARLAIKEKDRIWKRIAKVIDVAL